MTGAIVGLIKGLKLNYTDKANVWATISIEEKNNKFKFTSTPIAVEISLDAFEKGQEEIPYFFDTSKKYKAILKNLKLDKDIHNKLDFTIPKEDKLKRFNKDINMSKKFIEDFYINIKKSLKIYILKNQKLLKIL